MGGATAAACNPWWPEASTCQERSAHQAGISEIRFPHGATPLLHTVSKTPVQGRNPVQTGIQSCYAAAQQQCALLYYQVHRVTSNPNSTSCLDWRTLMRHGQHATD